MSEFDFDEQGFVRQEVPDEEPLLVVDIFDRVLGMSSKPEVHRQRQWHRQVYVLVVNSSDQVLLQRRSPQRQFDPDKWTTSVSGHVTGYDSYLESAQRELLEEVGLEHHDLIFLGKALAYSNAGGELCGGPSAVFTARLDCDVSAIRMQQTEVIQVGWFQLESVADAASGRVPLHHDGGTIEFAEDFLPVFELFWACYHGRDKRPAAAPTSTTT